MDRLIPLIDFVLEQDLEFPKGRTASEMVKYGLFLKQPLTLGMFVPCDLDGNFLEEPDPTNWQNLLPNGKYRNIPYQEAKERVLFEGFEVIKWDHGGDSYSVRKNNGTKEEIQVCYYKSVPDYFVWSFETIEQLTSKDLVLTESAKKQIRL